jgi:hypothetical protein
MKRASRNETTIYSTALIDWLCVCRPGNSYVITAGVSMGKETLYRTHVINCTVHIYTAHTSLNVLFIFIPHTRH